MNQKEIECQRILGVEYVSDLKVIQWTSRYGTPGIFGNIAPEPASLRGKYQTIHTCRRAPLSEGKLQNLRNS